MQQEPLPGASNALTFGILSIVLTLFCCGPFGGIFGFISLSYAKKAEKIYAESTGQYSGIENVKTSKVLSYIGLAIAAIYLLFFILYFGIIAAFLIAIVSQGGNL